MKKGITKLLISLAAALLTVVPFSYPVSADYSFDFQQAYAYAFWAKYGFNTVEPSTTISGTENGYSFTTSISKYADSGSWTYSVYNSNGTWLGYYTSGSGSNIYYHTGSGQGSCNTGCYVQANLNPNGSIGHDASQSFTIPSHSLSLVESGQPYVPFLTQSSAFPTISAWQNTYNIYYQSNIGPSTDDSIILSFIINKTITWANRPVVYSYDSTVYSVGRPYNFILGSGSDIMSIYTFEIKSNTDVSQVNFALDFPSLHGLTNIKILPIYLGGRNELPEDLGKIIGVDVGVAHLIEDGNSESQASEQANDTQNTQLNTSITNLTSQEDAFLDDMDDSLNDITWSSSLLGNSSLALSANWVKVQYERMTQNNVIGDIIQYAMLFGLGLLIVGKMR